MYCYFGLSDCTAIKDRLNSAPISDTILHFAKILASYPSGLREQFAKLSFAGSNPADASHHFFVIAIPDMLIGKKQSHCSTNEIAAPRLSAAARNDGHVLPGWWNW